MRAGSVPTLDIGGAGRLETERNGQPNATGRWPVIRP